MNKTDVKNGDNGITIITKVVVGSRLHNLHTEDSDWDFRGVHMHPIKDMLSPFKTLKNTTWIEGDEDNTSYELSDFCKSAVHGNATILEVFFSDQVISTSPIAEEFRENWKKFMDTKRFIDASRGYAHNQWNKFYNYEDVGKLGQSRTAKFAVAFLRVMWQCEQFLVTGEFKCKLNDCEYDDLLRKIKPLTLEELRPHLEEVYVAMNKMNDRLTEATIKAMDGPNWLEPDIPWIEDFIDRAYKSNG